MTETEIGMQRFYNWSRWANGTSQVMQHYYPQRAAVSGQYIPEAGDVWEDDPYIPVDHTDAEKVERFIVSLPSHMIHAIKAMYIHRDGSMRSIVEQAARELMAKKFHVV